MSRYRFARRPWWIASHVLVVVLVVVMIGAGFWQLQRYGERRQLNRLYAEREAVPVTDLAEVVDAADEPAGPSVEEATFRRVSATGTYDVDEQVLVRNRTQSGRPGVWILTPLRISDGTAVVVNRGFLPGSGIPDVPDEAAPPGGEVTVTGLVQPTQRRGRFGPTDPATGSLEVMSRVDLPRLQDQVDDDLYPVWLILEEQTPAARSADVPIPVEPPEPFSEARHLSYAFQWFVFTVIALVGYPFILRRQARTEERHRRRAARESVPAAPVPAGTSPNGKRALDVPVTDRPSS